VVLTGAGISAGSGIPTYRDASGTWHRSQPIQHQDFLGSSRARQRYWLRSFAGWPAVAAAQPTAAHHALAELQEAGLIDLLVTQNVDRLHQKAGHERVIDLHGRLDEVICLDCDALMSRAGMQQRLETLNPHLETTGELAPDGDADVEEQIISVPACDHCGGTLMPNVVFFGGSVGKQIVTHIYNAISNSDALLVIGSSLQVFSGYRFCRFAADQQIPIASINPGKTRADELMSLRIPLAADDVVPAVSAFLSETNTQSKRG
jgi:NAD-dependent SIR2 family protein deacetylase